MLVGPMGQDGPGLDYNFCYVYFSGTSCNTGAAKQTFCQDVGKCRGCGRAQPREKMQFASG